MRELKPEELDLVSGGISISLAGDPPSFALTTDPAWAVAFTSGTLSGPGVALVAPVLKL
jgi:hypothetical protein